MTARLLIRRSIRHNWRTHLGVVLGSALAALVLTGALMVGDSVKATLRAQAEARVGRVGEAFLCGERFVPWAAAPEKRPQVVARMFYPGADAAGVVLIHGSATRADGKARANRVQVVGVDTAFWKLSPISNPIALGTSGSGNPEIAINERLAAQLGVGVGDDVRIRLEKPSALSRDAPLGSENDAVVMLRLRVARVVSDDNFGRFALTSGQVPPHTAFIPLAALQEKLGIGEKVNVILRHQRFYQPPDVSLTQSPFERLFSFSSKSPIICHSADELERPTLEFDPLRGSSFAQMADDFDLQVEELPATKEVELRTKRIFLDPVSVASARKNEATTILPAAPSLSDVKEEIRFQKSLIADPPPGLDSLTYFVNELRLEPPGSPLLADNPTAPTNPEPTPRPTAPKPPATPYSFVTALDAPASGFVQAELSDDEIQITRWLADDLGAKPGDKITMRYFVMAERRELVEKARTFTILAPVIEMNEPRLDTSWMPDFPNIPDKNSFSKWKPGFPFDSKRIRKKDDEYWAEHRGTPKAFVNLRVGQEMWGNRWGNLTSIRYAAPVKREQVERIAAFIEPEALGFRIVPLREQALAATDAPVDFGQLFTAFSFFLIAAAAVLTGLLFTFSIEQRAAEAGLLLAVGWTRRRVKKLFLREGTLLAVIGSVAGVAAAALYTKAVLHGLGTIWRGATGGTSFLFAPSALTVGISLVAGVLVARLAMGLASRRIYKREAAALLSGSGDWETSRDGRKSGADRAKTASDAAISSGKGAESSGDSGVPSGNGTPQSRNDPVQSRNDPAQFRNEMSPFRNDSIPFREGTPQFPEEIGKSPGEMESSGKGIETFPEDIETPSGEGPKEGRFATALNPGGVPNSAGKPEAAPNASGTPKGAPAGAQGATKAPLLDGSSTEGTDGHGNAASLPCPSLPSVDKTARTSRHRRAPFPTAFLMVFELVSFCIVMLIGLVWTLKSTPAPAFFFGLGFALLAIGILFARRILLRFSTATALESGADLALRNTTRRRGRSLATIGVLASGVFMVVAVDSFRKDSSSDATRRDSGTGGFALIGESAAPIYEDLNSAKGREAYALDDKIMQGVRVVQMRVRDGDDASCLNLNKAVQPRVLGVGPDDLDGRFKLSAPKLTDPSVSWAIFFDPMLSSSHFPNVDEEKGFIHAVVDANTLQWALKKDIGQRLDVNNERGESAAVYVRATIAASILQGVVIIKEEDFISRFPNTAGYRFFLIDCPPEKMAEVREHLSEQLADRGLELTPAAQRLAEFNAVENTYLSIFQVLGGLGMLLGSAGLGIVVARNVLERRREFGLLEAVGFTPRQLRALVFAEHRWLIAGALGIGAVSALVAVWPGISQKGATFPWMSVGALFAGMAVFSALSAWVATRLSLRASQLVALRSE